MTVFIENNGCNLERFIDAQKFVYPTVLSELKTGRKCSHWMWFIFPQIAGLGNSPTAIYYAINSPAEALSYLNHWLLGARLSECTEILLCDHKNALLEEIFDYPDNLKFCSSMTLFESVANDKKTYSQAIDHFCKGIRDQRTLQILKGFVR